MHVDQERDRERDRRRDHDRAVGERAAHVGDAERERDREQGVEEQDRHHHRQRRRQPRREQVRDRLVGRPAAAPVEGDDLLEEDPELGPERLVQAELLADRVDLRLRRVEAGEDLRRIAAEALEEEEDEQDDAEQRRHHLPEASYQVGGHRRSTPRRISLAAGAVLVTRPHRRLPEERAASLGPRRAAPPPRLPGPTQGAGHAPTLASCPVAPPGAPPGDAVDIRREFLRSLRRLRLGRARLRVVAIASRSSPASARARRRAGGRGRRARPRCCATRCASPRPASIRRRSRISIRRTLVANMFDALYEYEFLARPVRLRPNTAAALPEASADFKTFTIRVKPGIYFSDDPAFKGVQARADGRRLRLLDQAPLRSALEEPGGTRASTPIASSASTKLRQAALREKKPFDYDAPVEGLRALDRYTIQIKLAEPSPRFADELSDPGGHRRARARGGRVLRRQDHGAPGRHRPVPSCRVAAQLADRLREEPELPRRLLRRGSAARRSGRPERGASGSPAASCR